LQISPISAAGTPLPGAGNVPFGGLVAKSSEIVGATGLRLSSQLTRKSPAAAIVAKGLISLIMTIPKDGWMLVAIRIRVLSRRDIWQLADHEISAVRGGFEHRKVWRDDSNPPHRSYENC
jgi:hypothetical protein